MRARGESTRCAQEYPHRYACDPPPPEGIGGKPQQPPEACLRAKIVLLSADGVGTNEIMRQTGTSKTCVWRWQERFMAEGFDGLLRDKTRPSRVAPLGTDVAERVVALTQTDPPAETTHWTALMMAHEIGISASSVQRIWRGHGLQPHRMRQFKLSNDPNFVENCAMWWAFMLIRRPTPLSCPSTRRAKSRRSTVPNRACP